MTSELMRVLVVDDSRIFRGVLEEALAGCSDLKVVGSVWSGEKALEFAKQSLPDFVTLDIEMPGLGGLATLRALRALAADKKKSLGVLLVSSHTPGRSLRFSDET
jgi:CheY-like chemotaxis protein